jgi:hypothetical protein
VLKATYDNSDVLPPFVKERLKISGNPLKFVQISRRFSCHAECSPAFRQFARAFGNALIPRAAAFHMVDRP